jgi:enoyl-CoA hydratase
VLEDLIAAFAAFEADARKRCAVVTGAGEKAFAAGADIAEMADKDGAAISTPTTCSRAGPAIS